MTLYNVPNIKDVIELLEILKSKGLIIEEEEEAKEILLRENYFGFLRWFQRSWPLPTVL